MNGEPEYFPIKVVVTTEADFRPPQRGGGKAKDFSDRYEGIRQSLLQEIDGLERYYDRTFRQADLPVVARLRLSPDTIAKSHRPDALLHDTCPVIGAEDFDELLLSVKPEGLARLKNVIAATNNSRLKSDIGKITALEPYKPSDVLGEWTLGQFTRTLRERRIHEVKLRLFTHRDRDLDGRLFHALEELAMQFRLPTIVPLEYGAGLRLFRISLPEYDALDDFVNYVGTQSIGIFQHLTVSTQSTRLADLAANQIPPPDQAREYPIVGIIDSGTDPGNDQLQAWVVDRDEDDVPRVDQDNEHGSLVAGLIVNGRALNHDFPGFPPEHAKIVDVVAYPSTGVREDILIESMRRAFAKYPHVKVWNLSINTPGTPVVNDRFSTFAIALDTLQDQFGVTIVNSTGNFGEHPAHRWPRQDLNQRDRILAPADSLRAITVGALAHLTHGNACAQPGDPSPFTRKGPGAAYVPKPEVAHFGGNTNANLQFTQIGIVSTDGTRGVAETAGTSFAAPLVAATAAHVAHAMVEPPSRNLLKALIVHSAVLHSPEISASVLPYKGFGKPPEPIQILQCRPWEATLIFELELPYLRRTFRKMDFPIPPCLHVHGKVCGEVTLTLVYDPPVDCNDGAAYSQVNIDCSLGTCSRNADGENYEGREIIPYPKDYKELFEKSQIEHGFKWSPVKVFRRRMTRVEPSDTWRVSLEMHTRKTGFNPPARQQAVLIATISDPGQQLPVFNEVVAMMNQVRWQTQNLRLRSAERIRVR